MRKNWKTLDALMCPLVTGDSCKTLLNQLSRSGAIYCPINIFKDRVVGKLKCLLPVRRIYWAGRTFRGAHTRTQRKDGTTAINQPSIVRDKCGITKKKHITQLRMLFSFIRERENLSEKKMCKTHVELDDNFESEKK